MRINEIANLINDANVCVDVGSDHANLSIILATEKKAKIIYNLEKNDAPLLNSINNTKQYTNIKNIKSDGFKNFDSSLLIDYCTISGMGANTIVEILNGCKNKINNIIICPNNNYHLIREWAKINKWKIKFEKTILTKKIYYEIIWLTKTEGKKVLTHNQCLFGIRKIKKNDTLYLQKLKQEFKSENLDFFKEKNPKKYKYLKKVKRYLNKYDC